MNAIPQDLIEIITRDGKLLSTINCLRKSPVLDAFLNNTTLDLKEPKLFLNYTTKDINCVLNRAVDPSYSNEEAEWVLDYFFPSEDLDDKAGTKSENFFNQISYYQIRIFPFYSVALPNFFPQDKIHFRDVIFSAEDFHIDYGRYFNLEQHNILKSLEQCRWKLEDLMFDYTILNQYELHVKLNYKLTELKQCPKSIQVQQNVQEIVQQNVQEEKKVLERSETLFYNLKIKDLKGKIIEIPDCVEFASITLSFQNTKIIQENCNKIFFTCKHLDQKIEKALLDFNMWITSFSLKIETVEYEVERTL